MSTYSSQSHYETETQIREREQAASPQKCPHCQTPINQNMSRWDKPKQHCGATACRSAAYRKRKADRLESDRQDATDRIDRYIAHLPFDQAAAVRVMRDTLMGSEQVDMRHGHEQALAILKVIEAQRCKHDRIDVLIENASAAKRRADAAREHNRELQEEYKHRIAELESELSVFQLLENAVHNIATDQLRKQPDPISPPVTPVSVEEDEDRAKVVATLKLIGIKPYTGGSEEDEDEDETENAELDDEDEEL